MSVELDEREIAVRFLAEETFSTLYIVPLRSISTQFPIQRLNEALLNFDISVNCNWVNTRLQFYSTHNQYIEQHNNNRTTQIIAQHNNNRKTIAQYNDNYLIKI